MRHPEVSGLIACSARSQGPSRRWRGTAWEGSGAPDVTSQDIPTSAFIPQAAGHGLAARSRTLSQTCGQAVWDGSSGPLRLLKDPFCGNRTHHATLLRFAIFAATLAAPAAAQPPAPATPSPTPRSARTRAAPPSRVLRSSTAYLAYDGWTLDHLSAGGLILDRITTFPVFGFASFVRVSGDGSTATSVSPASA